MKEKIKNWLKENWIKIIITVIVVIVFTYLLNAFSSKKLKIDYPYTQNVSKSASFACTSLISADIIGSPIDYLTNGIEGTLNKGTDKIAISIKDKQTLSFLTAASVEAGTSEGDLWKILKNDNKELVAILYDPIFGSINTLALNKESGLAVWSKARPTFITYDAYGSIIYMRCI